MHGPSATPLLVELAITALALGIALARKPATRALKRLLRPLGMRPARRRLGHP